MNQLKIYLFIIQVFFVFTDICYSQINGRVTYSTILEAEDYREMDSFLLFDSNENSVFYSIVKENPAISGINSLSMENKESSPAINVGLNFQPPEDSLKYYVHINRNSEQIKSKRTIFKEGEYYRCIVLEPMNLFEWTLINERRVIMSYTAYKAETTFRGRSYTAWYTPEIRLNAGPWKFNGLPGLILEVTDSENGVQFLLSSIDIPYETDEVIHPPSEELILTFDEYVSLNNPERIANEFLDLIDSKLPEGGKIISSPSVSFKKNVKGIERIF